MMTWGERPSLVLRRLPPSGVMRTTFASIGAVHRLQAPRRMNHRPPTEGYHPPSVRSTRPGGIVSVPPVFEGADLLLGNCRMSSQRARRRPPRRVGECLTQECDIIMQKAGHFETFRDMWDIPQAAVTWSSCYENGAIRPGVSNKNYRGRDARDSKSCWPSRVQRIAFFTKPWA